MTDKITGIYCIENITNNKKYIGMSRDIKRRWGEHRTELDRHVHNNPYLQHSWDKYGKDNFKFYILEICEESVLSERECYYIKQFNTSYRYNGYNLTLGGENTSIGKEVICLYDETIYNYVHEAAQKASVTPLTMISWCKQKYKYMYLSEYELLTEEEKLYWKNFNWEVYNHQKISNAHKKENLSQNTLKKLSEATTGANNPRATRVYCPELNEIFNCIKYASDKYGVNRGSITSCIKGRLKSAGRHPVTGEKLTWVKIENDI